MSTESVGFNRSTLLEMLHCRVVNVKFRKLNGDIRNMRCTLLEEMLPPRKEEESKSNTKRLASMNVVTVFDLDAADWRSIRVDHIIEAV